MRWRWPFVSRETHNDIVRVLTGAFDRLEEDYRDLLEKYHALKVGGASPAVTMTPLPAKARSDVQDAIELQAPNDPALARHLHRWAKRQQLDGVDEQDIVKQIMHWQSGEDLDDPFAAEA